LVPIKTPQTTIILDSGIECQCNSWKKLKLHRGCSEERWCVSIDFDLIIILACAHSIFSQLFRVSLLRPSLTRTLFGWPTIFEWYISLDSVLLL
jgi:hypothetical protein